MRSLRSTATSYRGSDKVLRKAFSGAWSRVLLYHAGLEKSVTGGREINRTLEDRGAIVLLDYRFSTAFCRQYLPARINRSMMVLSDEEGAIAGRLITFFG